MKKKIDTIFISDAMNTFLGRQGEEDGGKGSGNFGHAGRKGQVGGSTAEGEGGGGASASAQSANETSNSSPAPSVLKRMRIPLTEAFGRLPVRIDNMPDGPEKEEAAKDYYYDLLSTYESLAEKPRKDVEQERRYVKTAAKMIKAFESAYGEEAAAEKANSYASRRAQEVNCQDLEAKFGPLPKDLQEKISKGSPDADIAAKQYYSSELDKQRSHVAQLEANAEELEKRGESLESMKQRYTAYSEKAKLENMEKSFERVFGHEESGAAKKA